MGIHCDRNRRSKFKSQWSTAFAIRRQSGKLWDAATGRELPSLQAPNSGLFKTQVSVSANFSEDGKRVATGGFDTPTVVWETETGKQLLKTNDRTNRAYKAAFNADVTQLSSVGRACWD